MKPKKLLFINIFALLAFVFVVGAGVYQANKTNDEYGEKENKEVESDNTEKADEEETEELSFVIEEKIEKAPIEIIERKTLGTLALKGKEKFTAAATVENELVEEVDEEKSLGTAENEVWTETETNWAPTQGNKPNYSSPSAGNEKDNSYEQTKEKAAEKPKQDSKPNLKPSPKPDSKPKPKSDSKPVQEPESKPDSDSNPESNPKPPDREQEKESDQETDPQPDEGDLPVLG